VLFAARASTAFLATLLVAAAGTIFPYLLPAYPGGGNGISIYSAAPSLTGLITAFAFTVAGLIALIVYSSLASRGLAGKTTLAPAAFFFTAVFQTIHAHATTQPEVWLGPASRFSTPSSPRPRAVDLMEMFKPNAPWQNAASHVQVFRFSSLFFHRVGEDSNQDEVNAAVSDLKRRHIAIAVEIGVIDIIPGSCPDKIQEGYGTLPQARKVIDMIKAAGGEIKYLNMDELLNYGHFFEHSSSKTGCQLSISEIVSRSAAILNLFKQEFPNIVIGETEPTAMMREQGDDHIAEVSDWKPAMLEYYTRFRDALGKPLDFLILDPQWEFKRGSVADDVHTVYDYAEELKRRGLIQRIGIMYNGGTFDTTDAAWVQAARDHMAIVEQTYRPRPDIIAFLSWQENPTHAMPDDASQNTLTGLVTYYFQHYGGGP